MEEGLMENRGSKFYSKAQEKYFSWLKEFMSTEWVEQCRSRGDEEWRIELIICSDTYFQDLNWLQSVFCPQQHLKYIYTHTHNKIISPALLLWKQSTASQTPQPWLYFKVWLISYFSLFSFWVIAARIIHVNIFLLRARCNFAKKKSGKVSW